MINIQRLVFKSDSMEELLPEFAPDFPYIATCAELDKYNSTVIPWHWHRAVELFYMESGCLEYTTPHGKWVFPAGSGGLLNSNVLHTSQITQTTKPNIQLLHLFHPSLISGGHDSRIEKKYVLPLISDTDTEMIVLRPDVLHQAEILRLIRHAFELSEQEWGYELKLRELLTQIWLMLFDMTQPQSGVNKEATRSNDQIKQMMVYIHEHYSEHISVDELAQVSHVSKRACFRLFQENLHMTPVEYITAYRLRKACQMLVGGNQPMTEIANICGLGSSSYFGKIFREKYGLTPLEYRKVWRDRDISGHQ